MVLRGGWFVLAMMLLRLTQKLCQRRDVQIAESTSGQARCDLLEQPGVAIRVAERSKGKVAAVTGVRPTDATVAFGTELSTRFQSMEHLTDLDTEGNELFASRFNMRNDQVRPWAEPGAAVVIFVPNWTEHPEPGGVNWTARNPLSNGKSASSLHPSFV